MSKQKTEVVRNRDGEEDSRHRLDGRGAEGEENSVWDILNLRYPLYIQVGIPSRQLEIQFGVQERVLGGQYKFIDSLKL